MKVAMRELDLRYFVARVGGNVLVFDEEDENVLTGAMRFTAFQQLHAGRKINSKPVATAWLTSSGRRTYGSLVFDPSGSCDKDSYNTWRGLAVEPKPGQCGKILAHIRDIWCSGDAAQFEYVLKWMALLVQKPWVKPEVALVLKSREGTGKTIIVQMLLKLFGTHGFTTAKRTGRGTLQRPSVRQGPGRSRRCIFRRRSCGCRRSQSAHHERNSWLRSQGQGRDLGTELRPRHHVD